MEESDESVNGEEAFSYRTSEIPKSTTSRVREGSVSSIDAYFSASGTSVAKRISADSVQDKGNGFEGKRKSTTVVFAPETVGGLEEDDEELLKYLEEDGEEEEDDNESLQLHVGGRIRRHTFKFKKNETGNILTIHHTIQENKKMLRIRMAVCSFNANCSQLVAIDCRGHVFAFDLTSKYYWQLMEIVLKPSVIVPWVQRNNDYLVGTKLGQILRLDLDKWGITKSIDVTSDPIKSITFPGQPLKPQDMVLVQTSFEAILINLEKFTATHRLTFEQMNVSLKFACFLPLSENIFTCFTNDTIYIWSSVTLNTLRVLHPINARDRKLQVMGKNAIAATLALSVGCEDLNDEFNVHCQVDDYSDGSILSYCCHPDGSLLCLSTLDKYLLFYNIYTFDLQHICRLVDFVVSECVFLPQSPQPPQPMQKELMLVVLSTKGQVVLLDCFHKDIKLIIQAAHAQHINISVDGKLLAVTNVTGELEIWSLCKLYNLLRAQEKCMRLLTTAFKQKKPLSLGAAGDAAAAAAEEECLNFDLRKLLKRDRLLGMLREYRWFPRKYRLLIWCALLQLPYNRRQFQTLLRLGTPQAVLQRANNIKLRDATLKRALVRVWSCLAHWCKVFAHSDVIPGLIFPFVKVFPRNAFVAFEICATLLLNHFQLWFEYHPLEPSNYLGMCENLMQHFAPELSKFYAGLHIGPEHYAWPLLSTSFSEVFIEDQWLCLWDNILAWPPYFPVFIILAYNILQREVIVRLPDKKTVMCFFCEQNPVEVSQVISKAYCLMNKCPSTLHPKRYMKSFEGIPKGVYPKFLNYPRKWVEKQEEDVERVQQKQRAIDARIRQLELEEMKLLERLECGLRNEKHTNQIKKMEQLYRDTIKREEDRLACQQKMLLLYQKEIRNRKAAVMMQLKESEQRQKALLMEKELDLLTHTIERERKRTDTDILLAEDEIRNQDFELYAQKCFSEIQTRPLSSKYDKELKRFRKQRVTLSQQLNEVSQQYTCEEVVVDVNDSSSLDTIEEKINEIQKEFCNILSKK